MPVAHVMGAGGVFSGAIVQVQPSLLVRLDPPRDGRDRDVLLHPRSARTVVPTTRPARAKDLEHRVARLIAFSDSGRNIPLRLLVYRIEGPLLLPIHIFAGGLAIVLGAVALLAAKGGTIHRRIGLLFVYAMLVMGISASILAVFAKVHRPECAGGFMTAYFVVTALMTVRPVSSWTRLICCHVTDAAGLALFNIMGGAVKAFNSPRVFSTASRS